MRFFLFLGKHLRGESLGGAERASRPGDLITMVMMKEKIVFFILSYNKPEYEPGTRKKNVNEARDGEERIKIMKWKTNIQKQVFLRMIPIELDPAEEGGDRGARTGHFVSMACSLARVLLIFPQTQLSRSYEWFNNCLLSGTKFYKLIDL